MFSKLTSLRKFNNEEISIKQLYDIVRQNPQKDLIEKIRSVGYKSTEYKDLKKDVNCIMPHGIFSGLNNSDVVKFSNYIYYDIDGFDTEKELNDTILTLNDTFNISFICKSVGGKGISFIIYIDDTKLTLKDTNFNASYEYIKSKIEEKGFNIDNAAKGINRKMIISSDTKCILNDTCFKLNDEDIYQINKLKNLRPVNKGGDIGGRCIESKDTSCEIIPVKELVKQISTETKYIKDIDGDYVIDPTDYYRLTLPKIIKDGYKHKTYMRVINALFYLNNDITYQQVLSYIYYINNHSENMMTIHYLREFILRMYNYIVKKGYNTKPRIKRLHFNKNSKLTKEQKQNMGRQLASKIRNNNTINKINDAIKYCEENNEVVSQSRIQKLTGLSICTIKRNFKKGITKPLNDLNDIFIPELDSPETSIIQTIESTTEPIITHQIEEKEFWEGYLNNYIPKKPTYKDEFEKDFGDGKEIEGIVETITFKKGKKYI